MTKNLNSFYFIVATTIYSAQLISLSAHIVSVEVDITRGWHSFNIVGLPDKAVEEARERIGAAIGNIGFESPHRGSRRIIASLAPADIKKAGGHFDLAIALGYLLANKNIRFNPVGRIFFGELSLTGGVNPIRGVLLLAQAAKQAGFKEIFVPQANAAEAALIDGLTVFGVSNLADLISHLSAKPPRGISRPEVKWPQLSLLKYPKTKITGPTKAKPDLDLADIVGQSTVKRGLEIAAAGGHHLAMIGPPGAGKTMLAKAFAGILPELTESEMIETTGIHSVANNLSADNLVAIPPFRSPHHTASYAAMVGGGLWPKPGEVSLAHRGVLFLDEFAEFDKRVIEALRQPLEDRIINVSRSKASFTFPARFILLAAMNPCPCGHWGNQQQVCTCSLSAVSRYQRKLSGPIMDRLDLWLEVPAVPIADLSGKRRSETSAAVRRRVKTARQLQAVRFARQPFSTNSEMSVKQLNRFAPLTEPVQAKLTQAAGTLNLSARGYHRTIKLARTIADLDKAKIIGQKHILEALQYRPRSLTGE